MNGERKSCCFGLCNVVVVAEVLLAMIMPCQQVKADDVSPDPALVERIGRLIDQLGSALFDERESAAKELTRIGKPARTQLDAARSHRSAEVRSRVTNILRTFQVVPLRDAFQVLANQPEEKLNLEEGMWLVSRILNPDVEREALSGQLDALANKVRRKLGDHVKPKDVAPDRIVSVLRDVLFTDENFGGNFDDYQNPWNSSLEKVLETHKGLPILVSHVVVSVADRLEIPIVGVPAPGKYIVKYDGQRAPPGFPREDLYLDPFNNGKVLTRGDRMREFEGIDPDRMFPQGTKRDVLIRMLNNIETHLFGRDETDRAYLAVEFRVALQHSAPDPKQ